MHGNYSNNRENTYRLGVLEGNYVEEIYSRDHERSKRKEPRVMLSETQEKYGNVHSKDTQNQNSNSGNIERCSKDQKPTTIDSITKKPVNDDEDIDVEIDRDDERAVKIVEPEGTQSEPKINYLQSYKRLIETHDDKDKALGHSSKKINSAKKVQREGLSTHLFLNHGIETEKPANDEFLTTYNICYDKKLKPQDIVDNDLRSTALLSKAKATETLNGTEANSTINAQTNDVKAFSKKEQNFTRVFDKPHMSIGFRN